MRFIYTKAFAIFAVCVAVGVIFAFLQIKGYLDPIKKVLLDSPRPAVYLVKNLTQPVKNFFTTVYRLRNISDQNDQLSEKVQELQQSLVDYNQLKTENEALRAELGFAKTSKLALFPCTVLTQNPSSLTFSITLNCGVEQGIAVGQGIVSNGYLVGKIIYAGKGLSTALLITSSNFSSDAQLSQTGATGVVKGSFGSGIILDQLSQHESIEKGWLLTSAGINPQIPKNILIGEVGDVLSSQSDLFKKVTIVSPVDFNNLQFVFVAK